MSEDKRRTVLVDFLAWATTQDRTLTLGAAHLTPPAIEAMEEYLRAFPLPNKDNWSRRLT